MNSVITAWRKVTESCNEVKVRMLSSYVASSAWQSRRGKTVFSFHSYSEVNKHLSGIVFALFSKMTAIWSLQ